MGKATFAFIGLLMLAGCASWQAETPAQRAYAAQSDYNAALAVALIYESLPRCPEGVTSLLAACSEAPVVEEIRKADNDAFNALERAKGIALSPSKDGFDLALQAANAAIGLFNDVLANHNLLGKEES